jgi:hypothetical protein
MLDQSTRVRRALLPCYSLLLTAASVAVAAAAASGCQSVASDGAAGTGGAGGIVALPDGGGQGGAHAIACPLPIPTPGSVRAAGCAIATPPLPSPPSGTDPASVQAIAVAQEMRSLDDLIGRYLRGDAPVYRGSASARDNGSAFNPPSPAAPIYMDTTMSSDQAIAALVLDASAGSATLTVTSPCEEKLIHVIQNRAAPGITQVNGVLATNQYGGLTASCSSCAPDLLAPPATLSWIEADATYDQGAPLPTNHITSTVALQRESPCDLDWAQLVAIDANSITDGSGLALSNFARVGNEMVWQHADSVSLATPSSHGACDGLYVPYTDELYVNAFNLGTYGVRKYVAQTPVSYCAI